MFRPVNHERHSERNPVQHATSKQSRSFYRTRRVVLEKDLEEMKLNEADMQKIKRYSACRRRRRVKNTAQYKNQKLQ